MDLLAEYDYDVFFHTWDLIGYSNNNAKNDNKIENIKTEEIKDRLLNWLMPKKYIIEPYREISMAKYYYDKDGNEIDPEIYKDEYNRDYRLKTVKSSLSLFWGTKEVNRLKSEYEKENNFKYDIVFKTRFDEIYFTELNPKEILNIIINNNRYIYIPKGTYTDGGVNDQIAFGNSENMDIYAQMYDMFNTYFELDKYISHTEYMLKFHLQKQNVQVLNSDLMFRILRPMEVDSCT
jgi:hypothetical protein